MIRKTKKGFTIIELVIVIAVIGILSAVLIPTFVNLTNKASQAADDSLVKNLNTQLRMKEQTEGKNKNLTEALKDANEAGYIVENLTPKGEKDILWNQEKDEFVQLDHAPADAYKYWTIAKSEADFSKGYSSYLYFKPTNPIVVSTGFDVGTYENVDVSYVHTSGAAQKAIVRTNGGVLTINAPADTVTHYGASSTVDVVAVASMSYHENGTTTFLKIASGRVVVNDEAEVGGVYVSSNDAIVAVETTAELPTVYYSDEVTSFKVQTTNDDGEKQTESDVTISGETVTTEASEGEQPVPVDVRVKIEKSEQKTEEEAGEKAAETVPPVGVARIGTTGYSTFKEAVTAAQPGQKIYLIDDCELSETIGEIAQEGPNAGEIVNGLDNEVVLSKDVTFKILGLTYINLMPNGKFTMNEHTLKLGANTEGAGIAFADLDEIIVTLLEGSTYFADITVDIAHQSTGSVESGNYLRFNGMRWECAAMLVGGGERMFGPLMPNGTHYFDSEKMPRYNSEYKYSSYNDDINKKARADDLWFSIFSVTGFFDPEEVNVTLEWSVTPVKGDLQLNVLGVDELEAYVADTSNGFAALFDAGQTPAKYIMANYAEDFGSVSSVIDILSGKGEVKVTATVTALEIDEDAFFFDPIEVGSQYVFDIVVY